MGFEIPSWVPFFGRKDQQSVVQQSTSQKEVVFNKDPSSQPGISQDSYQTSFLSQDIMNPLSIIYSGQSDYKRILANIRKIATYEATARDSVPPDQFAAIQANLKPVKEKYEQLATQLQENISKLQAESASTLYSSIGKLPSLVGA